MWERMKGATSVAIFVAISQLPSVLLAPSSVENYVALIDAGSSGSRMHVFKWKPRHEADSNGVPDRSWVVIEPLPRATELVPKRSRNLYHGNGTLTTVQKTLITHCKNSIPHTTKLRTLTTEAELEYLCYNHTEAHVLTVPDSTGFVREIANEKKKPGLSSLADNPQGVAEHLASLVEFAKKKVPSSRQPDTPIYLMATAGLRLVPYQKRKNIFDAVHINFEHPESCPFRYDRSNSRILSGEEEGVFSWISANFHLGRLTDTGNTKTVGILEMGGASTQIAFLPEGQILADKFPVRVGARDYSLYVHSYLYYGQDYAIRRVKEVLVRKYKGKTTIENPCLFKGDTVEENVEGKDMTFQGTSDYDGCVAIIREFMYKVPSEQCYPFPCTIGNTYQPPLGSNFFYAIVAFFYTPDAIGALGDDGTLILSNAESAAKGYCSQTLEEVLAGGEPREYVSIRCLVGAYIPIFLHDGLGFSKTAKQITATKKINGKSIGWTEGAVIYEISRICNPADDDGDLIGESKADVNVSTTFRGHLTLSIAMFLSACAANRF